MFNPSPSPFLERSAATGYRTGDQMAWICPPWTSGSCARERGRATSLRVPGAQQALPNSWLESAPWVPQGSS
jgi:hypothetical protein